MEKVCHHKTEIGVDWPMFKHNFLAGKGRSMTFIYVLDECRRKASILNLTVQEPSPDHRDAILLRSGRHPLAQQP